MCRRRENRGRTRWRESWRKNRGEGGVMGEQVLLWWVVTLQHTDGM